MLVKTNKEPTSEQSDQGPQLWNSIDCIGSDADCQSFIIAVQNTAPAGGPTTAGTCVGQWASCQSSCLMIRMYAKRPNNTSVEKSNQDRTQQCGAAHDAENHSSPASTPPTGGNSLFSQPASTVQGLTSGSIGLDTPT